MTKYRFFQIGFIIITILVVSSVAVYGYFTIIRQTNDTGEDPSDQQTATNRGQSKENIKSDLDISNWKVYRNEEYGFELKFPATWEDYKVTSENRTIHNYDLQEYSGVFIEFSHPQKISEKGRPGEITFIIGIFDKKNWDLVQDMKKLGETNENVIGSLRGMGAVPDDMKNRWEEIGYILDTFVLLSK